MDGVVYWLELAVGDVWTVLYTGRNSGRNLFVINS